MKTRRMKIATAITLLTAFALGGAAFAGAGGTFDNEESLQGNERTQAEAAALKAAGGGTVKGSERVSEEGGVTFKVDVTKPDGSTVDVELDASYGVVATDSDAEPDDADDEGGEE